MSDKNETTTTTTEAPETTTTTTVAEQGTANTTAPKAEKQGEVKVDEKATADVVGGIESSVEADQKANAQNIEDAKRDALKNAEGDQQLYA